jgi:hypothetical protein
MRRLFLAAVGAMALVGGATAANAVSVVSGTIPSSLASLTPPTSFAIGAQLSNGPGAFGPTMYTFTVMGASTLFNGQIGSTENGGATQNINFTPPTLTAGSTGTGATLATFTETSTDPNPEVWAITAANAILLAPGTYTIDVSGTLNGTTGAYGGSFNVAAAPVPEAKTWAMMLLGFGAMGMVIRRRRKPVLAQVA